MNKYVLSVILLLTGCSTLNNSNHPIINKEMTTLTFSKYYNVYDIYDYDIYLFFNTYLDINNISPSTEVNLLINY